MKKKKEGTIIVSQVYEEAYIFGEDIRDLKHTLKQVKLFYKSKINKLSAEC